MAVTLSVTILLAVAAALLLRARQVGIGTALVLWLSGFTAASTGLAGPVNDFLAAIARLVTGH
ncbi:hypothetical protein AB0I39_01405 [Kitasatospora purpeofusca]|uniref:hypothetical protein n=1 Tax=Kitasatospora purpeofusca TaxID=67352 RepID=UPI0004C1829B